MHAERHQLYLQWQDTVDNSRKRDELINETGEQYGSSKEFLDRQKADLEDHKKKLDREKDNNKELESNIGGEERQLTKIRESLAKFEEERNNLEGEVAILRNQLSAFATELSNKRINVCNMNQVLGEKMQRLDMAKKKYQATKERLTNEKNAQDSLERANKSSENEYKESNNMLGEVDKEIRLQKETLFKESQKLFKLRAEQANLIGDILSNSPIFLLNTLVPSLNWSSGGFLDNPWLTKALTAGYSLTLKIVWVTGFITCGIHARIALTGSVGLNWSGNTAVTAST